MLFYIWSSDINKKQSQMTDIVTLHWQIICTKIIYIFVLVLDFIAIRYTQVVVAGAAASKCVVMCVTESFLHENKGICVGYSDEI